MASNSKLEKAALAADLARDEAAAGVEFAEDYRIFEGVKLYYPTVAHRWVLMKLGGAAFKKLDNFDKAALMAYVLSHPMPENLGRLAAELRQGTALDAALRWIAKENVPPEIVGVVRDLMTHPYASGESSDPTSPAPLNSTGGAGSSTALP